MIEIRPNCVQNIKKNLSKQKFCVVNNNSTSVISNEPVFVAVNNKKELPNVLKFFLNSFNQSAGNAGVSAKNNIFDRFYENSVQKIWAFIEKYRVLLSDTVVEVVKKDDKILGCYSLSFDKEKAYINFLAVSSDIKDSKMTVKTLLNMASRISELTKLKKLEFIGWTTDRRNTKAFNLFDKFLACKHYKNDSFDVDFNVAVSDFDATLDKYM